MEEILAITRSKQGMWFLGDKTIIEIVWSNVELCSDTKRVRYIHIIADNGDNANEIKDAIEAHGITINFVATPFLMSFRGSATFK